MAIITNAGVYWIIFTCLLLGRKASDDANTTEAPSFTNTDGSQANVSNGEYIGCYPKLKSCLGKSNHSTTLTSNSPDNCTTKCKEDGFRVAALFDKTGCACSCELQQPCNHEHLSKGSCGLPCPTNLHIFCGGYIGVAVYRVTSENTSNSECGNHNDDDHDPGRNGLKDPNVTKGPDTVGFSQILTIAGIGATVIIAVIMIFACSRKNYHRVIYSPRDHSSRWRAHATSQEHQERPPTNQQTPGDKPELPPRSLGSMQQISGAESEQTGPVERPRPPPKASRIGGPTAQSSCAPTMTTGTLDEFHEYTYVKPNESMYKDEEDITENEEGYLTPNRPIVTPQFSHGPYYSSRIPKPRCTKHLPDTLSDGEYYSSELPMPSIQD